MDAKQWVLASGVAVAVMFVALMLLVPQTTGFGLPMDEGAVLSYADRVREGELPHRDFLTFYGPGNPWLVAGAFGVFGASVETERAIGLLYRLLIVFSLFVVARRLAGLVAAALAGVIATTTMAAELVWAYASYGAIAFALAGVALAVVGAEMEGRRQRWLVLGAGLAAGVALLMRFDFAPAVVASALPLFLYVPSRSRRWYAGGFLAAAGVYVPYLVLVGWDRIDRFVGDLLASGDGRRLPLPSVWDHPGKMLVEAIGIGLLFIACGAALTWRRREDLAGRILLSAGLLTIGLLPWVLSRADHLHIRPATIVPLSLLPALVLLCVKRVPPLPRPAQSVGILVVGAATLAIVLDPGRVTRWPTTIDPPVIENGGRKFYDFDAEHARDVTAVVAEAERLSEDGESLFVGPLDLRRFNYGTSYVYFLLPKLEPASYYMEMNPGTATRPGSDFADELRAADWLILTSEWDMWFEPNESTKFGSPEPNEVVRDLFCRHRTFGTFRLYERCDRQAPA